MENDEEYSFEKRNLIHDYQIAIYKNMEQLKKHEYKNRYKSNYPYHEAILFKLLGIEYCIEESYVYYPSGIPLSKVELNLTNVKILIKKICKKLAEYNNICKFVHNDLNFNNILIYEGEIIFIHFENSYYEYVGEVFNGPTYPVRDIYFLLVQFYLKTKCVETRNYLQSLFELFDNNSLKFLEEKGLIFTYRVRSTVSYKNFVD